MSTKKDEHFMAKHKGPAKQFLALVGDDNGAIQKQIDSLDLAVKVEKDCYYIDNFYYSAKYGLKKFATLSEVAKEYEERKTPMLCLLVAFKTLTELEGAGVVAKQINADMKVIVIESIEVCPEHLKVEDFASENNFEIVYLNSTEQQLKDAEDLSETVGIARLVEIIQVCNWPWRIVNDFDSGTGLSAYVSGQEKEEQMVDSDFEMGADAAGVLFSNYRDWVLRQTDDEDCESKEMPEPQHAERVHLSPDSPTTTEGTTNHDDVSISVDIDLVYEGNKEKNTEKAAATTDKKNKQKTH